ncbi:1617_t:CDS:10 [Acaulospora morrowiae]|uniref:Ubiquilin n=1 Tax=Acaulospora morrowiae TaxID=94023 RepID=A0A9N9H3W8_9GLOM|nr:1617_t:CDS:10 [Acaulospora morrowiae]
MDELPTERSINVKFRLSTGDIFDYRFDPEQLTVQQLKEKLAPHTTTSANNMRLVYSGKILKDEDLVDSYGVKEGHTIHIVSGRGQGRGQSVNTPSVTISQRNSSSTSTNPFGMNPFGMGANFDQDLMRNVMKIVRSMVMQNPTMRQMIERNPEIGHIINDPSFIRQTMDMARNPELMREMMRNNDRALANLETIPGGFNHLRRMYHTLQEPLESASRNNDQSSEAANQFLAQLLNVERPPEGRINCTPLPNPWVPRNNNNITNSTNVLSPFGASGGISPFNFFGFPPTQLSFPSPSSVSRNSSTTLSNQSSTSSQTSETPNTTPNSNGFASNFSNITLPTHSPMSNDPEFVRRFQQLMQRYMTSPQFVASRQQMSQTYFPTSLFGSPFSNMPPSHSTSQSTSSQSSEPPETRFRVQLQTLEEMGFVDQAANIRALLASGGDVGSAIEILLSEIQ